MMISRLAVLILAVALLAAFPPSGADACPIPVFRYALEFWEPDPYRLTVFHSGALSAQEEELAAVLKEASSGRGAANLDVRFVDVSLEEELRAHPLYEELSGEELPRMVLQYPFIEGIEKPLWSGDFSRGNAEALLHSPAREYIAGRLAEGVKVWLLLESGDRRKDAEAAETLERELSRLEKILELPDPEQWWTGRDEIEMPAVRFDIHVIRRDSPVEELLVSMLINSEDDLAEFGSEPMVFPVYGRGIALWAIVGKGINAWNITDAAEFLTGPCSCQVKMLNPGVDLLVSADWEGTVDRISDEALAARAPVTGFEGFRASGEEAARRLEEGMQDGGDIVHLDVFGGEPGEEERAAGGFPAAFPVAAAVIVIGVFLYIQFKVFRKRK